MTNTNRLPRSFVALLVVSSLAVFLQSVTAGIFVDQDGRDTWVTVHGVIADVTWVTALAATIIGLARVRRTRPFLGYGAAALFLLTIAQTGIGHLITDEGMDGLIVVHVPLAIVIFGLATWLLIALARAHRVLPDVVDPYVDPHADAHAGRASDRTAGSEAGEPLPLANRR